MKWFAVFFLCLLLLILTSIWIFQLASTPAGYFRGSTGPALDEPAYGETIDPLFVRGAQANEGFENMKLITDKTGARLEAPAAPGGRFRDNRRFDYQSISPGARFEGDEGTIALEYFAIAYATISPEELESYSVQVPGRFFDANLEPMTEERILDRFPSEWSRQLSFDGRFPAVKFGFDVNIDEEVKVLGYQLLDPVLKRTLSQGYSWGETGDGQLYVSTRLQKWHAGPVELVMDVAFGPVETYEFAAETGTVQDYPEGEVKVVGFLPEMRSHSSSQSDTGITLTFVPVDEDAGPTTTAVVIATLPTAHQAPLDFAFFDSDGNDLRPRGTSTSDRFIKLDFMVDAEEIDTIRMKYYPHSKRLVFQFPNLPGLPEKNDSIDNLFDVHIPYMRIRHEHEMTQVLEALTGLKISRPPGRLQANFPVSYEAITVGEMFEEYIGMQSVMSPEVTVNPAGGRIEIVEHPSGITWRDWIEEWWQKVRP